MLKTKLSILSGGGVKTYLTLSGIALLLLVALVPDVTMAAPTTTTYTWQAKNGDWSGMFNDPDHWSPVGVPSATNIAKIEGNAITITFPSAEYYDTLASLKLNVTSSGSITWNGTNTIFRQITSATDNYTDEPFSIQHSGTHFFNLQTYNTSATTHYKTAISTISNGLFRITRPSSGNVTERVDFESGSYNFYDADGVTACPDRVMMICRNNVGNVEFNFHPGTSFRYPIFKVLSNQPSGYSSTFNFLGGTHEIFGTMEMPTTEAYTIYNSSTFINITNGAMLTVRGETKLGAKANSYYSGGGDYALGRLYRFDIADGGTLTFAGKFTHTTCGRLEMNVNGGGVLAFNGSESSLGGQISTGVVTVARGGLISGSLALGCGDDGCARLVVDGGTASFSQLDVGNSAMAEAAVIVKNGGNFSGNLSMGCSADSSASLIVDGGKADFTTLDIGVDATADAVIIVTNGALVSSGTFKLRKGVLDLSEGIAWTNTGIVRLGYSNGASARMIVQEGAMFRALYQFDVGSNHGKGTLDILGGTVWQRNPASTDTWMYLGNNAGSTGTVNLVSGTLKAYRIQLGQKGRATLNVANGTCEIEDSIYIGACNDPNYLDEGIGTMNVSGGKVRVGGSSTGNLGIGNGGAGELNVSGGEVDTFYVFIGQTARANAGWATLRQTGGTIRTRLSSDRQDVGVKMADAAGRNTRLILDGGLLRTHRIFGNKSRAAGSTGYAALSANGGTLETPFASKSLIDLLDEAKLGPKGLTVNGNYNCTIPQSFTDADDAPGEGLLVLAGPAVKTITATNSTVGRLDVADGTVLFTTNALGMQAVQHSAITVTNNATLSLEGEQTSLTVRSLVLGNANSVGRLKLDPGDVIRVEGALTVNSGVLLVTDDFAVGSEYALFELLGSEDRSAELASVLNLLQVNSSVTGRGYTFRTEYDQATGKTTAKVVVEEMPEPGVTSWRGPGTDWETDANWSDDAPGMADVAVFDSETAPAVVTVTGKKLVGGLVFNAVQGYTLAGGGLSVQSTDETRIDATQGVHAVESRLWLPDGIPVTVASGAGLTLGGVTIGGELVKQGAGRLAITNDANGLGSLTVTGGTLAVSSPAVLGGTQAVRMKVGAIEFGGEAGTDTCYTTPITLINPITTNALTLRTQHDVTLNSLTVSQGLPYKDGSGRMTIQTASSSAVLSVADGDTGDWCPLYQSKGGLVNYDADGLVTDDTVLAGLTVAEGELRLFGTSDNAVFKAQHYLTVGVPGANVSAAPPTLTIDHVKLDNNVGGKHLILGAGLKTGNSTLTDVYLTVTNGAEVSANTLYVARESSLPGVTYHILVDAATLSSSWRTHSNCNSGIGSTSEFTFRNGARFYVGGSLNMPYRSTFVFDDSIMAKNSSLDLASLTYKADYNAGNYTRAGGDFTFRNGSTLYLDCGAIDINSSQATSTSLTFDNSEWIPVKNADCTFAYPYPAKVGICTENTGLILTVPENCTWTMGQAVKGTGGLVKRGAGTLVFETHKIVSGGATNNWANATTTLDFTGTLAVESGKVVVKSGAAAAGAKFSLASGTELDLDGGTISVGALSGTGAVKNGTVTGTIPLTLNDDWTVAEDLVAFDAATVDFGRVVVDLGRTAANPVTQPFGTVVVGRYTGDTPPDVRRWRVTGAGMDGVAGTFTAADGEIRMTLRLKGVFISFR